MKNHYKAKFLTILFAVLLIGCNSGNKTGESSVSDSIQSTNDKAGAKKETNKTDTFTVAENCVIFLMPDTVEIAQMQKENSEEDYSEIVADITWYPGVAGEVLDSFRIPYFYVGDQHILVFELRNTKTIQLDKREIEGNMILFRSDTLPFIDYAIGFDREFSLRFFGRK